MTAELYGKAYLANKLNSKRNRVLMRYKFYDSKNQTKDFGIATPPNLKNAIGTLGWTAKAVDSLADRLNVLGIDEHNDELKMKELYQLNNPDVLFDSAIKSSLIGSCSFIYVYKDGDEVKMQVIGAADATGVIDETTGLLTEGYAVLERDKYHNPELEAYFTQGYVEYYKGNKLVETVATAIDYVTLIPVIYRPSEARPFGQSRISRSMMYLQNAAVRSVFRSEISAEFYSYPQKYATGVDSTAETNFDSWRAAMTAMLTFSNNEDGDKVSVGQFQQGSQSPHLDQIEMLAGLFAGECGLVLDDLGFFKENPASSQSIKAAHENLRLTARKAQKVFSSAFINAGFVGACLRDSFNYKRSAIVNTELQWLPIFEPDMSELGSMGDAIYKINSVIPNYFNSENMRLLTGIEESHKDDRQ
jgi:hypothetical protein